MTTNDDTKKIVWECPCGWRGREDEMNYVQTFRGSREEPPEGTNVCPECAEDWEDMYEAELCVTCNEVFVDSVGENCAACAEDEKRILSAGCPRCRGALRSPLRHNALSRRDNETVICSQCGTKEALEDAGYELKYEGERYWT